ncbi:putative virulence plasmid b protein [Fusarium bulbicola]|nr:putative virulence plasmid b protein [Fusarium bulbicola]
MDLTGYGTTDVVQIFSERDNLSFRCFGTVITDGKAEMKDGKPTRTTYDYAGTIDWFVLCHAKSGATSLVRVWAEDVGKGTTQILATTFSSAQDSSSGSIVDQGKTSVLWKSAKIGPKKYHVIPCDINADGVQDIVLATAEYHYDEMVLEYTTFLGDGQGSFQRHEDTVTRRMKSPTPLALEEPGSFHMSNLNGSNYPSICYVYRERNRPSYSCLTVEGLSSGLFSNLYLARMEGDTSSKSMEIVATDLSGNGIGDWLFHTIENDQPSIMPFYNQRKIAGLLEWSVDPIGLKTNFSYGTLSDPEAYSPSMSWEDYKNDSTDSYTVLGAPNYVVTALEHCNSHDVNSIPHQVMIKKKYSSATVSNKGRGWQGFGTIHTFNLTDNIEVIEDYHSAWPFTGQKRKTTTGAIGGTVLRAEKVDMGMRTLSKGPWKIYSIDRTFEQIDMLDEGAVNRSNVNQYSHDEFGSVTSRHSFEKVHGRLTHESWQRFTYISINGVTGLLTGRKVTSSGTNTNMSKFEPGDASLMEYKYDETNGNLVSESEWSTDVNAFATKTFALDPYGNEAKTTNAAGLCISTTYDDTFRHLPIKVEAIGPGVSIVQFTAFDQASGLPTAKMEGVGSLECCKLDGFGRALEVRVQSDDETAGTSLAEGFLDTQSIAGDSMLMALLPNCNLAPYRQMRTERHKSLTGLAYITTKAISFSGPGSGDRSEDIEVIDCAGRAHKRFSRHGDATTGIAMFREYDSGGHCVFETIPTSINAPTSNLDWIPDRSLGLIAHFDALGRPTLKSRPANGDAMNRVLTSTEYRYGSTKVLEKVLALPSQASITDATQLELVVQGYVRIDNRDFITEVINENDLRSTFTYDAVGNMVLAVDPAGNQERRTYNTKGKLTSIDNLYQRSKNSSAPVTYRYDIANHLVSEENAAGEVITFKRDAKGRPLEKKGQDGRTIMYSYNVKNSQQPSIVTLYSSESLSNFESRYEFGYDDHGRETGRKLTLGDGKSFYTQLQYNWQGKVIEKVFPDGSIAKSTYRGDLALSSSISGTTSTWTLKADLDKYNPVSQGPERVAISGTGIPEAYQHEWSYNPLGFPLSHTLRMGTKSLVQEHYGSDHRRAFYEFDTTGNITSKDGTSIAYSPGQVIGTKAESGVFDVAYDSAGRMTSRTSDKGAFWLVYDSFGRLQRYYNEKDGTAVDIFSDFNGLTLQKRYSNGTSELTVDNDFSISAAADGSYTTHQKLLFEGLLIGTVSNKYESFASIRPLGNGQRAINIPFTDNNGSVTHLFEGNSAKLERKYNYNDFGMLESDDHNNKETNSSTYEGNSYDSVTGLLDFGGRWYDPLVGRFTSPDDIVEMNYMIKTDGLNRYAFENNDPINHVDPTGHWSWSSLLGLSIGIIMVVAAVAITFATGGAGGILVAAAVGALAGGGVAGITYSIDHHDEDDAGRFWGGFGMTVCINALIGAVAGGYGAAVGGAARVADATVRVASKMTAGLIVKKAVIGGLASVASKVSERAVSNIVYGTDYSYTAGLGEAFATGALVGGAVALAGAVKWGDVGRTHWNSFKGLLGFAMKAPKESSPFEMAFKAAGKEVLKHGWKLGWWVLTRDAKN